ncbi:YitT family protein [Limosilactobacillus mucosae]|uniref:YitT family protein n=1 Tax=Limosilactobacillus mucosae TaxID=97478 RepID=UPI0039915433
MFKQASTNKVRLLDLLMITIGCGIYALGFVKINIANRLAEGGVTGISLIIYHLFHVDPSISTLCINIPLIIIGYRLLGRRALIYTVYGTIWLSIWIWIWQRVPFTLDIQHDLFISGVLAGLIGGFGSGIVYRFDGTTGGSDVVARMFERHRGVPMGRSLLICDAIVLTASLSYIDIRKMMYTLLASYVFSKVVNFTQAGSYPAQGFIIISTQTEEISNQIMRQLERGVTLLKSEGAYSHQPGQALYCVVASEEVVTLKRLINDIDPHAFITTFDIASVEGEGFTYDLPNQPH